MGRPWPEATRTGPREPRTVLLIGDSLLQQAASDIPGALAFDGVDATVVDVSRGGSGLLDPGLREYAAAAMDEVPEGTIVVFEYSGNCFYSCPVLPGSPEFYTMWEQVMRDMIADAQERGLVPMWAKSPPFAGDPGHSQVVAHLADIDASVTYELGIGMPDWWSALTDALGAYQHDLWYADLFSDPAWHVVRQDDGVHLTPDGGRRAASWTAAAIAS